MSIKEMYFSLESCSKIKPSEKCEGWNPKKSQGVDLVLKHTLEKCYPASLLSSLLFLHCTDEFHIFTPLSLSLSLNLEAHKWHDNSKFSAWVNAFLFVCLSLLRLSCFFFFLQLSEKNSKCSLNGWHVFRLRSWHAHPILMGFLCSYSAGPGRSLGIFGGKGLSLPGNGRNVACQMAEM